MTENQCLQCRAPALEFPIKVLIHPARWNHMTETGLGSVGRMKEADSGEELLTLVQARGHSSQTGLPQ